MLNDRGEMVSNTDMMPVEPDGGIGDGAAPLDELLGDSDTADGPMVYASQTVIGASADGVDITAYHFGNGAEEVLLIGGTHGSYSANTHELAEEFITYLGADESLVPDNLRVTVIPTVNPDGLASVVPPDGLTLTTLTSIVTLIVTGRAPACGETKK